MARGNCQVTRESLGGLNGMCRRDEKAQAFPEVLTSFGKKFAEV